MSPRTTGRRRNNSGLWIVALFIVVIFATSYFILTYLTPPARLQINLQSNQISQPQDGVLFYKLTNNKNQPLTNITINNSVVLNYQNANLKDFEKIDILEGKEEYSGKFVFDTAYLSKGSYTVKTELSYLYKGEKKFAELTLQFEVF